MIETLNNWDTTIFLFLNSLNNTYLDGFMWLVSGKFTWVPMCCVLLFFMFYKNWKQAILILFMIALTITFADQISSTFIKPMVERLRPTHEEAIASLVHIVNDYRGGRFGFVSSHAANSVGVAFLLILIFKNRYLTLTLTGWAILVSYSRIYLGVHYPGDILGGTLVGLFSGALCYYIYKKIGEIRLFDNASNIRYPSKYTLSIASAILLNIVGVMCYAIFMF